jgi:ribonucleoside-diphosphate reductase alpha chain
MITDQGPVLPISLEIGKQKYLQEGEEHAQGMARIANHLSDNDEHYKRFYHMILSQKFCPAGRVQSASGSLREVTAFNCFVSNDIGDSFDEIMEALVESGKTMRLGGGIGYDFSTLRPRGSRIKSLDSKTPGPVTFMDLFDSMCATIASAGHRRGAQMGVLRVDHPDIVEFVNSKTNSHNLKRFNISVGVTDAFMQAVVDGTPFDLVFDGEVYQTIDARTLYEQIMRATWDWAEPGILFIDRMNRKNNLWHLEKISATNPCGEQPLPPYGACLLGSINLAQYIYKNEKGVWAVDIDQIVKDMPDIIRAMDNIIDRTTYPLPQQEVEAKNKRRMGIGVTGLANAIEICGHPYGSRKGDKLTRKIMKHLRDACYNASIDLAIEKGAYPLWNVKSLQSEFFLTMPDDIRERARLHGMRNSHLLSIAPTGTISLYANNVSSGLEPPFLNEFERTIQEFDGVRKEIVRDFAYQFYGVEGVTADKLTPMQHLKMLTTVSEFVDSACSKTINVGSDTTWEQFNDIYITAWKDGASGCTTFRADGKRYGILNAVKPVKKAGLWQRIKQRYLT